MNIKVVSEKTGLTKKAIKYYESMGLINPKKNLKNNYRDYENKDITELNLIGALRILDVPVCEIKSIMQGKNTIQEVMKSTLKEINESIVNLEKSKVIINNIIEKNNKDYYVVGENIKKLRKTLEYSVNEKKEFLYNILLRIFPGNFGKAIVTSHEPFLNIVIDNKDKKDAWVKLVEFLDDLDECDLNNPLINQISAMDNNVVTENSNEIKENIFNILKNEREEKEKHKEAMFNFIKNLSENEELKKQFVSNVKIAKKVLNVHGEESEEFDKYLEILSDDYKKYKNILNEINNEVDKKLKKELGYTREEFFKSLLK